MKRIFAVLLVLCMALCFVACQDKFDPAAKSEGVMTHDEYVAAEVGAEMTIEAFVQGHQSWWDNKITVYLQDKDGGYLAYELACSEDDSKKLTPGTKIQVKGFKGEWAGEMEVVDCTFTIMDGTWVAEATDVTALLGKDEMIDHQNEKVAFKDMTIVGWTYKNETQGQDIYVTLSKDGAEYSFCVESYLTGPDSDTYKAVEALVAGDVVDIEGFAYWYEGLNTHITSVTKK